MPLPQEDRPSDMDLDDIRSFLSGDRRAFDRLVTRHADRVFNLCYRLLGDPDEANDCAQEVFIKVFQNVKRFRMESAFSTWLFSIAVNTCRNRRKSAEFRFWRRILRLGQDSEENEGVVKAQMEDPAPSPLALLAEKERDLLLQKAIDLLPHDQRTVIVLRHIEELSYEEICRITGYNLGTLKSKLARGRQTLHRNLQSV